MERASETANEPSVGSGGGPAAMVEEELPLPLQSLNHVSFTCRSVKESVSFYKAVLGFDLIKRPSSLENVEGAWLVNDKIGIQIHLIKSDKPDKLPPKPPTKINPRGCHISFHCSDVDDVKNKLDEMKEKSLVKDVEKVELEHDDGMVTQLFFHDPDGYMIEICNCQDIRITRLSSSCPEEKGKTPPLSVVSELKRP